jgi:hypothetical protein
MCEYRMLVGLMICMDCFSKHYLSYFDLARNLRMIPCLKLNPIKVDGRVGDNKLELSQRLGTYVDKLGEGVERAARTI